MKALGTNVLVRYLVQDDPVQAAKATSLVEDAAAAGESLFVSSVVLCELVWVLESAYEVGKPELLNVLEKILTAAQIELEHRDCAWAALRDLGRSKADFSDCLIGQIHRAAGCEVTVTFDRATRGLPTFLVL